MTVQMRQSRTAGSLEAGFVGRVANQTKEEENPMSVEVGEMAPDFELPTHREKGKTVKLSDFRGKKNVFIAFYPLAWTPV